MIYNVRNNISKCIATQAEITKYEAKSFKKYNNSNMINKN
jgi:hypothetical protein